MLAIHIVQLYGLNIYHTLVLYYYVTGRRSLLSGCPVLLWEVAAGGVHDIDILPGGDVIAACGGGGLQVYDKMRGQKIQHPISDMCKIQHPISDMCKIQHLISDMCKIQHPISDMCNIQHLISDMCKIQHPISDMCKIQHPISDMCKIQHPISDMCKIQHPISDMCEIQHPISDMCKIQHPISDMCQGYIRGVSVGDEATVAAVELRIGDPGRLHIYTSVNSRWKHQMYNTCKMPQSVACTGDGHFILGSDNHYVYKYNTHGQQIWEKKLSFWPGCISTDHKNRILVSNSDGGCVTVYNEDGVEMFSFPAATDQRKLKPQGLCVDDQDNILVVDGDSKFVLLYDSHGQFLEKLVGVEGDPESVGLCNDSYLAVEVAGKLRLYKL